MALSERQIFDALSRMPFIDTAEVAGILGEAPATIHRSLASLLADGVVVRMNHGTAHLPSSRRYFLTAKGIREATRLLSYDTPSDYVRAYPMSKEWLTLLIRRMDAVATIYRLAAALSPGMDGLSTQVVFFRRGRFDAAVTLHDGSSFGIVRQGLALQRRSLYDRLKTIAKYYYTLRPGAILVLTPSKWEERLTARFCIDLNLQDCYVAAESRDSLTDRHRRLWQQTSFSQEGEYCSLESMRGQAGYGGELFTGSSSRKRASIPDPERMVKEAPTFGLTPAGEAGAGPGDRHPTDSPEASVPLAGRVRGKSQSGDAQPHRQMGSGPAKRQTRRYPLQPARRGHKVHHLQRPCPTPHHTRHLEHETDFRPAWPTTAHGSPHRHVGEANQTRRRRHLVPLEARRRSQRPPRQQAAVVSSHRQVRSFLQMG